jgi:peptidoglycan/xylan/chitin deacetylase (PgdA/CDA1 family)
MIALTFDDGPDPEWTVRLLAVLEQADAVATFFVDAGRAQADPRLIEAIAAGGHEVGFHCHRHRRHSELSDAEVEADVATGLAALATLGVTPSAWRAPWGVVTAATRSAAASHGLELYGWSFDTHDWRGDSAERMLGALEEAGGLSPGEVVLMHDGIGPGARRCGCAETLRLSEALLDRAAAADLPTVAVSRLAAAAASA